MIGDREGDILCGQKRGLLHHLAAQRYVPRAAGSASLYRGRLASRLQPALHGAPEGGRRMRIVVHDYSGHPFQIQLSRALARQGHDVLHLFFESFQSPRGAVHRRPDDPRSLEIEGIVFDEPFDKYRNFVKRRRQEIRYGKMAARRIAEYRPDLLLSGNAPLDAQKIMQRAAERLGSKFVFWLQDIYSIGIGTILKKRGFPLASLVGAWYTRLERKLLSASHAVIMISPDFAPVLQRWGVTSSRLHTIENWAVREEISPHPQDNPWSREHDLAGRFVFLYSGTIGMKHNPALLVDLAASMREHPDVMVVVISEGEKAEWISREIAARGITNLKLLPLQPWERMAEVLSAGSVLTALLGEESGAFSVPSKVLSYLCAGRPLLLSVPEPNLAARIVSGAMTGARSGLVAPPGDDAAFIAAAHTLHQDHARCQEFARNALAYAENTFDIARIAARFTRVFEAAGIPPALARPGSTHLDRLHQMPPLAPLEPLEQLEQMEQLERLANSIAPAEKASDVRQSPVKR